MTPENRARIVPTLFILGGVAFALSGLQGGLEPYAVAFSLLVGVVVAGYGVWRLREARREPPR